MGIRMGSVSLSSSTSKDGNQPPMLPHLAPDRLEDPSLAMSGGPDITFGIRDPMDTTVNTSPLQGSKEEEIMSMAPRSTRDPQDIGFRKGTQLSAVEDPQPTQKIPETPPEDVRAQPAQPGANLPPQLQAEGEAFTNELLEYLLQDLSAEGLDHLINRQTRR